jgi:hypothetical protein
MYRAAFHAQFELASRPAQNDELDYGAFFAQYQALGILDASQLVL